MAKGKKPKGTGTDWPGPRLRGIVATVERVAKEVRRAVEGPSRKKTKSSSRKKRR
jgi:hypothetical protein